MGLVTSFLVMLQPLAVAMTAPGCIPHFVFGRECFMTWGVDFKRGGFKPGGEGEVGNGLPFTGSDEGAGGSPWRASISRSWRRPARWSTWKS